MIIFGIFLINFFLINLIFSFKKIKDIYYLFFLLKYLSIGYFFLYFFNLKTSLIILFFIFLIYFLYLFKINKNIKLKTLFLNIFKTNIKFLIFLLIIFLITYISSHNSKRLMIPSSGWDAATHFNFIEIFNENFKLQLNEYPKLFHYYLSPFYILFNQLIKNVSSNLILKISILSLFVNTIVFYPFFLLLYNIFKKNKIKGIFFAFLLPIYFEIISKISVQGHYAQLLNNFFILSALVFFNFNKNYQEKIIDKLTTLSSLIYSYYFFLPGLIIFIFFYLLEFKNKIINIKNTIINFFIFVILLIPIIIGLFNINNVNTLLTVWGGVESLRFFDWFLLGFIVIFFVYKKFNFNQRKENFFILIGMLEFLLLILFYQYFFVKVLSYSFFKILLTFCLLFLFLFLLYYYEIKIKNYLIIFLILISVYFILSEKRLIHFFKGTFNFLHPHIYNTSIFLLNENYDKNLTVYPFLGIEQNYWLKRIFERKYKVDYTNLVYDINNLDKEKRLIIFDPIFKFKNINKNMILYPAR